MPPPMIKIKDVLQPYLKLLGDEDPAVKDAITFDKISDRFEVDTPRLAGIIHDNDNGKALGHAVSFFQLLGRAHKDAVQTGQIYQNEKGTGEHPGVLNIIEDLLPLIIFDGYGNLQERETFARVSTVLLEHIGTLDALISKHPDLAKKTIGLILEQIHDFDISYSHYDIYFSALGRLPQTIEASGLAADVVNKFLSRLMLSGDNVLLGDTLSILSHLGGVIEKSGLGEKVIGTLMNWLQNLGELYSPVLQTLVKLKTLVKATGHKDELLKLLEDHSRGKNNPHGSGTMEDREQALRAFGFFNSDPNKIESMVVDLLLDLNGHGKVKPTVAAALLKYIDLNTLPPKMAEDVLSDLVHTLTHSFTPTVIASLETLGHFKDFMKRTFFKDNIVKALFADDWEYDDKVFHAFCETLIALKDTLLPRYKDQVMDLIFIELRSIDLKTINSGRQSLNGLENTLKLLTEYKEVFNQHPRKRQIMSELVRLMESYFKLGSSHHHFMNVIVKGLVVLGEGLQLHNTTDKKLSWGFIFTWPGIRKSLRKILLEQLNNYQDPETQRHVIMALGVLGRQIAGDNEKTLGQITEKLMSRISDNDPLIQNAAVEALRKLHPDFDLWLTRSYDLPNSMSARLGKLVNDCIRKLTWPGRLQLLNTLSILWALKETINRSDDVLLKHLLRSNLQPLLRASDSRVRNSVAQLLPQLNDREKTVIDVDSWIRPLVSRSTDSLTMDEVKKSAIDTLDLESDAIIELGREGEVIKALQGMIRVNRFPEESARTIVTLLTKMAAKAHPPLPIEPNSMVANLAMGAALMSHGELFLEKLQEILRGTDHDAIAPQLRQGLETLVAGSGDQIVPDADSLTPAVENPPPFDWTACEDPALLTAAAFMQMAPLGNVLTPVLH